MLTNVAIFLSEVWTEARSGIGATNFITGMGGFLQTVLFGYGGFRLHLEYLLMNATLPPGATSLTIQDLDYMGARMTFKFTANDMTLEVHKVSSEFPLAMQLDDIDDTILLLEGKLILVTVSILTCSQMLCTHFIF